MKNIPKLIRRFAGILFFSLLLLIILNVCLLSVIALQYTSNASPWQTAKETADAIQATDSGIGLPGQITRRLVSARLPGRQKTYRKTSPAAIHFPISPA